MKLGLMLGYSGAKMKLPMALIKRAEALGYDSVWTAEAWGSDAVTPLAWILGQTERIKAGTAIMQMAARTPAMTAMTAMTLDQLSGGRFILGVGPSGPQVVEGWHGEKYGKPLTRQREYVEIIRKILRREGPAIHHGEHYHLPNTGAGTTGLGKPLKSILHGDPNLPIYTASITPKGISLAAEIADGFFPVWMDPNRFDLFAEALNSGFTRAGGDKSLANFAIAPFVRVVMGDDVDGCRAAIKQHFALYIGGMGARHKNFYNDYMKRMGYEGAATKIQALYLGGEKDAAAAAVPDDFIDACSLVGPPARIKAQLGAWQQAYKDGHLHTMIVTCDSVDALTVLADMVL